LLSISLCLKISATALRIIDVTVTPLPAHRIFSFLALSAVAVYINIIERYRFMLGYIPDIVGMECPCRKEAFRRFKIATAEQET